MNDRSLYGNPEKNAADALELDEAKGRIEAARKSAFLTTVKGIARTRGLEPESVIRLIEKSAERHKISDEVAMQRIFGVRSGDEIKTTGEAYAAYRKDVLGKTDEE